MTPQKQAFRHNPAAGIYGDCFRTAIACLLDVHRDEIPHDHAKYAAWEAEDAIEPKGSQWEEMQAWLAPRGLFMLQVPFRGDDSLAQILLTAKHLSPGVHHILCGQSATPANHVVVCLDGEIVWDTSLTDSGIVGPQTDGNWYLIWLARLS